MRTRTKFLTIISNAYHPDILTVFLPKQCRCTCVPSFIKCHFLRNNRSIFHNPPIHKFFYPCNFVFFNTFKMVKVKTKSFWSHKGTGLLGMLPYYLSQGVMQQMCCRMITFYGCSSSFVNNTSNVFICLDLALYHLTNMHYNVIGFLCVADFNL